MNGLIRSVALGSIAMALGSVPPLVAQEPPVEPETIGPNRKSEGVAFRASLLGTAGPIAAGLVLTATGPTNDATLPAFLLITGGLAFGPSLGHFYAGRPARAAATAAVRAGVIIGSLAIALGACPLENCTGEEETTALVSLLAGGGVVAGLVIYDIASAPASVRARNRRISVAPWIPRSSRSLGGMATVQF